MATIVDALIVAFGAKTDDLKKGVSQAESLVSGFASKVKSFIAPLAGMLATGALFGNFTSQADALGKAADAIGMKIEDLDAWSQAVGHAGGSVEGFKNTLTGFNTSLQTLATTGTGRVKPMFDALGISVTDAKGNTKQATDVLLELAEIAETMDKAEFAGIAQKLGLDQGTIMLLQSGSKETRNLVDQMKDFSYTKEDADVAAAFNDAMQDLGKSFQSCANIIFRIVTPALTFLADTLTEIFRFVKNNERFVIMFLTAVAGILAAKLIPQITTLGKSLMTNPLFGLVKNPAIAAIIAGITALVLLIEDFVVYVKGGESALGEFWAIFGTGEEISQALAETWEELKEVGTLLWEGVKAAAKTFFSYFDGAIEQMKDLFKNGLKIIKALLQGNFGEAFNLIIAQIGKACKLAFTIFTGTFRMIKDAVMAIFRGIASFIGGIFDKIVGFIVDKIKSIVSVLPDWMPFAKEIKTWANGLGSTDEEKAEKIALSTSAEGSPQSNEEQRANEKVFDAYMDETIRTLGLNMQQSATAAPQTAAEGQAPTTVTNNETHNDNSQVNINASINVTAPDAQAAGTAVRDNMDKLVSTSNKGVRQ